MGSLQTLKQLIASEGSIAMVKMVLTETNIYRDVCQALAPGVASCLTLGVGQTSADLTNARLELLFEMACTGETIMCRKGWAREGPIHFGKASES